MCIYTWYTRAYLVVRIIKPPENIAVCRGWEVTISCGYQWSTELSVTWVINGTSFSQDEILDSHLYKLNNPTSPTSLSLTVLSINDNTTFQCVIHSSSLSTTSTLGTVTVIGTYVHTIK